MNHELHQLIEELTGFLQDTTVPVHERAAGATDQEIAQLEEALGITLPPELREWFRFSNGWTYDTYAAVISDQLTPLNFMSVQDIIQYRHQDSEPMEADEADRMDSRIKPFYYHAKWIPLAEFNGGSTQVLFDTDPAAAGKYGQIIVYQHDPDFVYYVAEDFRQFLRLSNQLLSENKEELLSEYL